MVNFLPYNDYFLTEGDVAFLAYMVHINLLPKIFFCATEVMVLATLCSRFFFSFFFVCFFLLATDIKRGHSPFNKMESAIVSRIFNLALSLEVKRFNTG